MGAGRKTQTIIASGKSQPSWTANAIHTSRNLRTCDLAAVIFGCKHNTFEECFSSSLFGLPAPHFLYVKNIYPGMPLFLFNYSDRKLHGIFEAANHGGLNINSQAWIEDGLDSTPYAAQVKFHIQMKCQPLVEDQFGPIIAENYYAPKLFWFELDHNQTKKLISLFSSSPIIQKQNVLHKEKGISCVRPSSGLSYCSIVKSMSSSVVRTDQSDIKQGTCVDQLDIIQGVHTVQTDSAGCYSSDPPIVGGLTTSLSKKPWTALFNKARETEDSKTSALISNLSNMDQYNLQFEPSPYLNQTHVLEAAADKDGFKSGATLASFDIRQEGQVLNLPADCFNAEWSSSCVLPLNEESQPSKVNIDRDLPVEEHIYAESNCESLYEAMANVIIAEDNQGEDAAAHLRDAYASEIKCKMLESSNLNTNELLLIAGGFDGSLWLSGLDSYSPFQDLKKPLASMNSARSHASAAKLNGELYVFGGVHGDLWYDTVESYNPTSNQWISRPSLSQRKGHLAGVSLNNKIFAVGGGNADECLSEMEMLDVNAAKWIPAQSMLERRYAPAAAEISGTIYVVGGYDGGGYLNSVERFDPREESWRRLASMTTKRGWHSLAVLNDKLYALGGYDGQKMVSTVEVFDPRLGSWMMEGSMNLARGYFGAVVMRDAIYAIGGLNDNGKILDTASTNGYFLFMRSPWCSDRWSVTSKVAVGKQLASKELGEDAFSVVMFYDPIGDSYKAVFKEMHITGSSTTHVYPFEIHTM
ncbi:conserved hypothetical protein [Ricinus communis]|uniref:DCD domain-containing protein n=1 Tax=Ricinus communis TaxID=3988 RepID=B9S485_RICCO|nr:conserved hypothetical protein [Ricinus communis]